MYGKFLVEGDKLIRELLASNIAVDAIYATDDYQLPSAVKTPLHRISKVELEKISTHETPNQAVAVAVMPATELNDAKPGKGLVLVCDNINDPGNAGTIIRTAEWFGVSTVCFSKGSVDVFNPKVVNAAKGSLFRVSCFYCDVAKLLIENKDKKVYGTFMEGESIYTAALDKDDAFIVIGNEANGISPELFPFIHQRISIPARGKGESLNVAIATALVLNEFSRPR